MYIIYNLIGKFLVNLLTLFLEAATFVLSELMYLWWGKSQYSLLIFDNFLSDLEGKHPIIVEYIYGSEPVFI